MERALAAMRISAELTRKRARWPASSGASPQRENRRDGCPARRGGLRLRAPVVEKLVATLVSTPGQNLTLPPVENLTVRRGDEPQFVATS